MNPLVLAVWVASFVVGIVRGAWGTLRPKVEHEPGGCFIRSDEKAILHRDCVLTPREYEMACGVVSPEATVTHSDSTLSQREWLELEAQMLKRSGLPRRFQAGFPWERVH